jgi:hypothetical protein
MFCLGGGTDRQAMAQANSPTIDNAANARFTAEE